MESISSQFVYFLGVVFLLRIWSTFSHWKALRGETIEILWVAVKTLNSVQGAAFERCCNFSLCAGKPWHNSFSIPERVLRWHFDVEGFEQTLKPASFLKYQACQVSLVSHGPVSATRGNTWNCAIYGNHSVDALAGVNEGIAEGACCVENVQRMLNTLTMNHRATFC